MPRGGGCRALGAPMPIAGASLPRGPARAQGPLQVGTGIFLESHTVESTIPPHSPPFKKAANRSGGTARRALRGRGQ